MIVVGIDPGLSGAIVAVRSDGGLSSWADTPTQPSCKGGRREYDVREMVACIREQYNVRLVVIERQQAYPGQGVSSTFATGRGAGLWEGIVSALGLAYEIVRPAEWQRAMLAGVGGEGKMRSVSRAQGLFPRLPVVEHGPRGRTKVWDGRADAALLAAYGARR